MREEVVSVSRRMKAISRWLSAATPPEKERNWIVSRRGCLPGGSVCGPPLASLPGCEETYCRNRWCRCAQPPANHCEASGFKTAAWNRILPTPHQNSAILIPRILMPDKITQSKMADYEAGDAGTGSESDAVRTDSGVDAGSEADSEIGAGSVAGTDSRVGVGAASRAGAGS
jgi:hypothetical protein